MSFYFVTLVSAFFINGMLYTTNTKIFHHLTIKHWNSIFAVVSSIFQGGVCGLAGKFPSGYVNAVISGQALGDRQHMSIFFFFFQKSWYSKNTFIQGGIFAALANIISIALGASPTQSAFIYFLAADVTLVLSFCLYMVLSSTVS
jgi:equilibrative nucleoside transporter 1/2/3